MAADITKWGDHALILAENAEAHLNALYSLKQTLDLEASSSGSSKNAIPVDITIRGGVPDPAVFTYNSVPLQLEAPARPPLERMSIFIDPGITGLLKQVAKKFPNCGDLGKVKLRRVIHHPQLHRIPLGF